MGSILPKRRATVDSRRKKTNFLSRLEIGARRRLCSRNHRVGNCFLSTRLVPSPNPSLQSMTVKSGVTSYRASIGWSLSRASAKPSKRFPLIPEAPPRYYRLQPNRYLQINPPKLGACVQTVDSRRERCRSTGTKGERADIIANLFFPQDVGVCITCYEPIKKVNSIRSNIFCSFISHAKTIHAAKPQIFMNYA
jgi:hypothetical protein